MMYTSLCGGSIDDVVQWLHNLLQYHVSQKKIKDGASMVVPVLKHYKTLQGIVNKVPFTPPQVGGTLAEYWDYLASHYMCKEAELEAALIRIFLANDPYYSLLDETDTSDYHLDIKKRASEKGILKEVEFFNSEARNSNLLPLSIVYYPSWIYVKRMDKTKYPHFENIVLNNDDIIRKNPDGIFQKIYSEANGKATRIVTVGQALKEAEAHYAKGLYLHSIRQSLRDEMHEAQKFAKAYPGIRLPEGKLNPGIRRTVWLYHACKEESDLITQQDLKDIYSVDRLAIDLNNKPDEVKFRRLGKLLGDGFMGMHPQPELWEKLRTKAFDTAKEFGLTKYVLDDEPHIAKFLFEGVLENSKGTYNEKHITAAWLGLAWLRWSAKDYSDLTEALEYVSRDKNIINRFGRDFVNDLVERAKNNDTAALERLALLYCTDKEINKDDPIIKDVGKLFVYRITDIRMPIMEEMEESAEKLVFMTVLVQNEMELAGYSPRLLDYIIRGLENEVDYFYTLLIEKKVLDRVYKACGGRTTLAYVIYAIRLGNKLEKQRAEMEKDVKEAEAREKQQ